MTKRLALLAAAALFFPALAGATEFGGFYNSASQADLKPFARDLGGLLGSDTFHTGRVLGFSGFDMGGHIAMQFLPDKDDAVMRANGAHPVVLPWAQAEVGLPLKIDGFVRGTNLDGMTAVGGGLRYGLLRVSDVPWKPQLLAIIVGNAATAQWFTADHVGASLVGSMGNQTYTPYLGIGLDRTRVTVTEATANVASGTSALALESRFTAGIQYRPWTFLYADAAYVFMHGQSGAEAGLGMRF
ncbi:MAG TPA: hypothetical protein VNK24_00300 [Elusimicrobiota bacterium]|nr:hypothetical protein [Elusimicrobiota bacterium]